MSDATIHHYGDDVDQFVQYWPPPRSSGPATTASRSTELVLIHGGYWRARYDLGLMEPMARRLSRTGRPVLNVEYRRVGQVTDPWVAMATDVETALTATDVETALTAADIESAPTLHLSTMPGVSDRRSRSRRRVLIGHSAGGHLALWAAAQPWARHAGITGVVALAPVSDLVLADELRLSDHATAELFGQDPARRQGRLAAASPRHLLPLGVPQYVIHGDHDDSVPQSMSTAYVAAAREAGDQVEFETPSGVDHFDIIDPDSEIWPTIEAALDRMADGTGLDA